MPDTKFENETKPTLNEVEDYIGSLFAQFDLIDGRQILAYAPKETNMDKLNNSKGEVNSMATDLIGIPNRVVYGNAIVLSGDAKWD